MSDYIIITTWILASISFIVYWIVSKIQATRAFNQAMKSDDYDFIDKIYVKHIFALSDNQLTDLNCKMILLLNRRNEEFEGQNANHT